MSLYPTPKPTRAFSDLRLGAPVISASPRSPRMALTPFALSKHSIRDFCEQKHVYAGGS